MEVLANPVVGGAVSGLAAAVLIDVDAYNKSAGKKKFSWKRALTRWGLGALTGVLTALGASSVSGA